MGPEYFGYTLVHRFCEASGFWKLALAKALYLFVRNVEIKKFPNKCSEEGILRIV